MHKITLDNDNANLLVEVPDSWDDNTRLTGKEAQIILGLLRQAGPSVHMNVDNPARSVQQAVEMETLLLKLKHIAGEDVV